MTHYSSHGTMEPLYLILILLIDLYTLYITDMQSIVSVLQIILGILLVITILLQQSAGGLGAGFGGGGTVFTTKRGVDKVLFQATIALSILFFALALASVLI